MRRHLLPSLRALVVFVLLACAALAPTGAAGADRALLRAGWVATGAGLIDADPSGRGIGLPVDLELVAAAFRRAGVGIVVMPMGRGAAEAALAAGTIDLLFPVVDPPPPASVPYRSDRDGILCARNLPPLAATGIAALEEAYGRGWRIAVVDGVPYSAAVTAMVTGPRAADTLRFVDAGAAVGAVAAGRAQCLVASRLAILGALSARPGLDSAVARGGVELGVVELRLRYAARVAVETIAAIDSAILAERADGSAAALEARASRPILLGFAIATSWFGWLDVIGTVAFALSGVLIARAERFSLLGAFVLAALPAVGGGVVRDLLLGRRPIGILADPMPLTLVIATVLVAYLVMRAAEPRAVLQSGPLGRLLAHALEVTDAAGLAAFTVIGVVVAVRTGAEPLWLWGPLAAAIGGAGGGILRDVLRTGYANPALRTSFYAEVCVIWGTVLTLAILFLLRAEEPILVRLTVGLTVLGAFATRMAVVVLGIRSPAFARSDEAVAATPRSSPARSGPA